MPNFNIFCSLQHSKQVLDCVKKYLIAPTEVSSYKTLVFQQAIQVDVILSFPSSASRLSLSHSRTVVVVVILIF